MNNNLSNMAQQWNSLIKPQNPVIPKQVKANKKKKVLVWSDAVVVSTGFGVVSRYILEALYKTGLYEIDQLAINYAGDFVDVPYRLVPARLRDPQDPYGNQMLINALQKGDYDILFVINDTFVVEGVAQKLKEVQELKHNQNKKVFKIVYYYPVDCAVLPQASTLIKIADRAVSYTHFGALKTAEAIQQKPSDIIYHGTDIKTFRPFTDEQRKLLRMKYFKVSDPETFIWLNVNRNNPRKNIAQTILAFSQFKKEVPNTVLYLHMKLQDGANGVISDLNAAIRACNLEIGKDVLVPSKYSPVRAFPPHILNEVYNCGNGCITTHLGEGWGLTVTEAMAAGIPVVAPSNTSMPEILGFGDNQRGYIYPCKEQIYIDNSGFRPVGLLNDVLQEMKNCYIDFKLKRDRRDLYIKNARSFTEKYSWDNVNKQWINLFNTIPNGLPKTLTQKQDGEQI